jgi:hypothetical protein
VTGDSDGRLHRPCAARRGNAARVHLLGVPGGHHVPTPARGLTSMNRGGNGIDGIAEVTMRADCSGRTRAHHNRQRRTDEGVRVPPTGGEPRTGSDGCVSSTHENGGTPCPARIQARSAGNAFVHSRELVEVIGSPVALLDGGQTVSGYARRLVREASSDRGSIPRLSIKHLAVILA